MDERQIDRTRLPSRGDQHKTVVHLSLSYLVMHFSPSLEEKGSGGGSGESLMTEPTQFAIISLYLLDLLQDPYVLALDPWTPTTKKKLFGGGLLGK